MITIKSSNEEQITFGVDIQGASEKEINARLHIYKENIEYGFPVVIEDGQMLVNLPALDTIIGGLADKEVLEAKMDIIANGEFFTRAWSDTFQIDKPVRVVAKVQESKQIDSRPKITLTEGCATAKKSKKLKPSSGKKKTKKVKKEGRHINLSNEISLKVDKLLKNLY